MFSIGRFTRGIVAAALIVGASGLAAFSTPASAQTPPATFYGMGLKAGDVVAASIGGKPCGTTTVTAAGEWSLMVAADAACGPAAGAAVAFTLNGAAATPTSVTTWVGGGLPADVANGIVFGAAPAATPAAAQAPVPPRTGNLGLATGTAGAALLALLALGASLVVGGRVLVGRARIS